MKIIKYSQVPVIPAKAGIQSSDILDASFRWHDKMDVTQLSSCSLAIVVSRFNSEITEQLYQGALERLKELNFPEKNITVVSVPGAVEIPVIVQQLAQTRRYHAVIALGCVIRGETSHYEYVCQQVSEGCQKVALKEGIPVIFGVLTTENETQAFDRAGGKKGNKGRESVDVALEMIAILEAMAPD